MSVDPAHHNPIRKFNFKPTPQTLPSNIKFKDNLGTKYAFSTFREELEIIPLWLTNICVPTAVLIFRLGERMLFGRTRMG